MLDRSSIGAVALAALLMTVVGVAAFEDTKYPDLKGQWSRPGGQPRFDPHQPRGPAQNPPLTAEYRALFEASQKDMAAGGQGNHPVYRCLAWGMPAMMTLYSPMEIIVLPEVTYMMIDDGNDSVRRIFTDGRDFPTDAEAAFVGYSIGKWLDEDGDGKYDVLEIETRNFKGPRAYDNSGLILHSDNESIIKERIYLDKADRNVLHDQLTVIDHGLTRPWTVIKDYNREPTPRPYWREDVCAEGNNHIFIGTENYMRDADGELMPAKKGQAPPDLRYFKQPQR